MTSPGRLASQRLTSWNTIDFVSVKLSRNWRLKTQILNRFWSKKSTLRFWVRISFVFRMAYWTRKGRIRVIFASLVMKRPLGFECRMLSRKSQGAKRSIFGHFCVGRGEVFVWKNDKSLQGVSLKFILRPIDISACLPRSEPQHSFYTLSVYIRSGLLSNTGKNDSAQPIGHPARGYLLWKLFRFRHGQFCFELVTLKLRSLVFLSKNVTLGF